MLAKRGLTLAELMVSLLVLAVLTIVMLGVVPASLFGVRQAQQRATASMLAREALEEQRARSFGELVTDSVNRPARVQTVDGVVFEVLYNVSLIPGMPADPELHEADGVTPLVLAKQVEVVVSWRGRQGLARLRSATVLRRQ